MIPEFIIACALGMGVLCIFVVIYLGQLLRLRPFSGGTLFLLFGSWQWIIDWPFDVVLENLKLTVE